MFKKIIMSTLVLGAVLSLTACGADSVSNKSSDSVKSSAAAPKATAQQTAALEKAKLYASTMHMSKQGIYVQLTSQAGEKFAAADAQYAIDNVKADWNANALEAAKNYQTTMSMSKDAILNQLTSQAGDKFTQEQAQYAVDHLQK